MEKQLSFEDLKLAVSGSAAAFRCITEYQPMGGRGDKVFPPTYEGGKYATEERVLPDYEGPVPCVLLNSVQSEANHMELALLDAWEEERISLPVITVDFTGSGLKKDLRITSLEAPHRIADALLRDSQLDGVMFRKTPQGQQLDRVDNKNATALLELCPTALLFGMWDSTGPRGGLGAKFARALVSEIVGINAQAGKKTGSRIDPAGIQGMGPLYKSLDGNWTLDEKEAIQVKGKPAKLGKDGKPSEANHGNVTPSISDGGFTIDRAIQTTVISIPALRRLRFPTHGSPSNPETNSSARTLLAALGLLTVTLTREKGMDLRSRCQLYPTGSFVWELLDNPDDVPHQFKLNTEQALHLYNDALQDAKSHGLPWLEEGLKLSPTPQLAALVKRSQELASSTTGAVEDA